uniref:Transmembrane protein n=1 Tax=Opuntia streptacantha TaxID=393608 RepID=A0A7C9D5P3_OPUST
MSPILQNPLSNSSYRIKFCLPNAATHFSPITTTKSSLSYKPSNPLPTQTSEKNGYPLQRNLFLLRSRYWVIKAYDSSTTTFDEYERPNKQFNFDSFLSVVESLCSISSLAISVGCIVNWVFFRQQNLGLLEMGHRVLLFLLAGAVALGSVIRTRQWRRVCGIPTSKSKLDSGNGNVIERIEKLEESMKSSTTIIRMLSRQLEKLGVRFRLHRKALKEPIAETSALAQKNSEATRALAAQADILEKELVEVQKVLLAMQDQQQKQVELILAIAKSGKLLDTKQEAPSQGQLLDENDSADKSLRQVDGQQIQAMSGQKDATSDVALES